MLRKLVALFAARPAMTLTVWVAAFGFGAISYTTLMPREGFPPINVPIAVVNGVYLVDDPAQVDADVVQPILGALDQLSNAEQVQSFAQGAGFGIVVSFDSEVTSPQGAAAIREAIAGVELPAAAQISVNEVNAAKFLEKFDLLVGIFGPADLDAQDLQLVAGDTLDTFTAIDGIGEAEVVELITTGVDPNTGQEVSRQGDFNLFTAPVSAPEGDNPAGLEFRPSIAVGLVAGEGVDALGLRAAADQAIDTLNQDQLLPEGHDAVVAVDFATSIRQQIGSLQSNVLTGVIAVAIIALLLISWRASVITAVFLVTVLATTIGVLFLLGISLNTISLFGVILALGLLVDDAIVITESIAASKGVSNDEIATIDHAIAKVGAASLSGTVTTVLVFAPMLAISGILGSFIRILPITVMVALLVSVTLSFIFIPVATRYLVLRGGGEGALARAEKRVAARVAAMTAARGRRGAVRGTLAVGLSLAMTFVGFAVFAPKVGFNIFPPQKDANFISLELVFAPGTNIEQAQNLTLDIVQDAADNLGEDLVQGYVYQGNERQALAQFDLVEMGSRATAVELVQDVLQPMAAGYDGVRATFDTLDPGPPAEAFPFQAQVYSPDAEILVSAAETIRAGLDGATISRPNGTIFTVTETELVFADSVARNDGRRLVEIRARFDADDVSTLTTSTQEFLEGLFPADELAALGLAPDGLQFDFGFESENQESFSSLPIAFLVALVSMLVVLIVQFRSISQPLLVFLAIPFSFFGVFGGLLLTGNVISFFVMLGLIGLIGIAVNNTILLTDYANQERAAGADRRAAVQAAIQQRFRPLVATSLTTVAGLTPLALSDPFWEALAVTIIFGLLSSTFLVLISFPFYYLGLEAIRDRLVTPWRKGRSRGGFPDHAADMPPASPGPIIEQPVSLT